jgi:hypothetical protein
LPPRLSGQALAGPSEEEEDKITLEPLRPRTFDKTSPVTAYWLPRCDGFEVVGARRIAVVEHAVFDDDPLHPVALRVRVGNKRRRLIPIDAVEAVCPLRRLLYVRRRPSVARRAGNRLVTARSGAGRVARTSRVASVALWRAGVPRARTAAQAAHGAARRRWPAVRRGAVLAREGCVFVAHTVALLVVAVAMMSARLLRFGVLTVRRYAPIMAAFTRSASRRGSRRLGELSRQTQAARRRRSPRALDDPESAELLDSPLRAEALAHGDAHVLDEPPVVQPQ